MEKDLEGMPLAERLYNQGIMLYSQEKPAEAFQKLKEALTIAKKEGNNLFTFKLMSCIADFYSDQSQEDESIPYLKDMIKVEVTDSYLVYDAMSKLANLYWKKGDFYQSESYFIQYLGVLEKSPKPDNSRLKLTYERLVKFYREFSREDKAKEFEERAKNLL